MEILTGLMKFEETAKEPPTAMTHQKSTAQRRTGRKVFMQIAGPLSDRHLLIAAARLGGKIWSTPRHRDRDLLIKDDFYWQKLSRLLFERARKGLGGFFFNESYLLFDGGNVIISF